MTLLGALLVAGVVAWAPLAGGDNRQPDVVRIPAGPAVIGSDRAEREAAYALDEAAYGHDTTRRSGWYENEPPRRGVTTGSYFIMRTPVTNARYMAFVRATGHPVPTVDERTWSGYGLNHPYARTRRHAWTDGQFPRGRGDHPVVLVSRDDATAYAAWLGSVTGRAWRLPTEIEWEKAARGPEGRRFPWGDAFDPARLDSADAGPFDTVPVGRYPAGDSPYGVADMAGLVYEWTATPFDDGGIVVKGGSWDDKGCGVCRPAARHGRPAFLRHIIIGFRLVREDG